MEIWSHYFFVLFIFTFSLFVELQFNFYGTFPTKKEKKNNFTFMVIYLKKTRIKNKTFSLATLLFIYLFVFNFVLKTLHVSFLTVENANTGST